MSGPGLLSVTDLAKVYGPRVLFDGVSMALDSGENVGLIGANGSGKSTLLKIIAGEESSDRGTVSLRTGATLGYLRQEPDFPPELTILEVVEGGRPDLQDLLRAFHQVSREITRVSGAGGRGPSSGALDRLLREQSRLSAEIDQAGGWDWEHQAQAMLSRVGVTDWDRTTESLSGGERRRVSLAQVLLAAPDLLLLDEPTNHLDADTVAWLEEFLTDYRGSVLLITHDRYFLDRVVDRTYEVTVEALVPFEGGYSEYLEEKAARMERASAEAERRLRMIERELEWARRAPPARTGKQRARLKRIRDLKDQQKRYRSRVSRDLAPLAKGSARLGRTILEVEGLGKAFGDRTLFREVDLSLRAGERIGLIGPNGAGKTTLLRILMGDEAPDRGEIRRGITTKVSYFDQRRAELDPEDTVYEAAAPSDWVQVDGERTHLRSYLDRFLFPVPRQLQKVSTLSGGERSRLILARLFMEEANLLVLDEPTNDLDLLTLQVLEEMLLGFSGCVLLVTHDRYLLDKVATSILVFDGRGRVFRLEGGYERYLEWKEEQEAREREEAARARERDRARREREAGGEEGPGGPGGGPVPADGRGRKLTWKEERELETLEARLAELEEEKATLEARLADPALYGESPEQIRQVNEAYARAGTALEEAFARWAELEERRG